jgi:hypothetical protein
VCVVASAVDTSVTSAAFALLAQRHDYRKWLAEGRSEDSLTKQLAEALDFWEASILDLQSRFAAAGAPTFTDLTVTDLMQASRLHVAGGTAVASAGTDFTLSAGFGVGRAITADSVSGTGSAGVIQGIVPAGTPAANPTVTLTFPGGARASTPLLALVSDWDFNSNAGAHTWCVESISATTLVVTHVGTPVADERIGFAWVVIG